MYTQETKRITKERFDEIFANLKAVKGKADAEKAPVEEPKIRSYQELYAFIKNKNNRGGKG